MIEQEPSSMSLQTLWVQKNASEAREEDAQQKLEEMKRAEALEEQKLVAAEFGLPKKRSEVE